MKQIGRYIIRGLLGQGGMGKVYRVELPPIGKIAALKLLRPDPLLVKLLGISRLTDQFTSEARTLAGLQHPHIVSIHDFDHWRSMPFYVMDYYANNIGAIIGESYTTESPSRVLPVDRALEYTRQILEALAALHDAGIIHRDIKPFNLLITAQDRLKLCDFGLSKLRGEIYSGPRNLNVGSPYYAAPEQEKNPDIVDQSADLYSVGVTLYRLLTGHLPEASPGAPQYLPPSHLNSDLDQIWDDFLAQSMAFSPQERFTSAISMRHALDKLVDHWQSQKNKTCALPPADKETTWTMTQRLPLRAEPLKLTPEEIAPQLDLDTLWRPKKYFKNDFEVQDDAIIIDRANSLVWQRQGSNLPLAWESAHSYVTQLNKTQFGGQTTWRLPTMAELVTLLRPSPQASDLCLPSLFGLTQRHLWSADRRSYIAAYFVEAQMGFVGWSDISAPHYVRAVSSVNF
ncbi:MAG: protein kinase [Desulfobacteraceae bacterium]|nr:protein kinase [Desulfobacteraceae bacterium]